VDLAARVGAGPAGLTRGQLDGGALQAVGLDRTELMNKLAGGSVGTTLAP
jgi:hypothetical protein